MRRFFALIMALLFIGTSVFAAEYGYFIPENQTDFESSENYSKSGSGSEVYGIYGNRTLNTFSYSGSVSVDVIKGDEINIDLNNIMGICLVGDPGFEDSFINEGSVSTIVGVNSVSGNGTFEYIKGIQVVGGSNSVFTNRGDVSVMLDIGNLNGNENMLGIYEIYGIRAGGMGGRIYEFGRISNFRNLGSVSLNISVGDINSNGSWVEMDTIYGINSITDNFTNTGSVSISASVGRVSGNENNFYIDDIYGLEGKSAGDFINEGQVNLKINVESITGDSNNVYIGYYLPSIHGLFSSVGGDLINTGQIGLDVEVGTIDGNGNTIFIDKLYGISGEVEGDFENTGSVSIAASVGDINGNETEVLIGITSRENGGYDGRYSIHGIEIDAGNFTNKGDVNVSTSAGNINGNNNFVGIDEIYGISGEAIGDFENTGDVSVNVSINNITGNGNNVSVGGEYEYFEGKSIYGLNIFAGNFTNTGNVNVDVFVGSVNGNSTNIVITDLNGVYGEVEDAFENLGDVRVSASVENITGDNSEAFIVGMTGVGSGAETFINNGDVSVSASVGDVSGDNAEAEVGEILGVVGLAESFINNGDVNINASVGNVSGDVFVNYIYGMNIESNNFVNTGDVNVSVKVGRSGNSTVIEKIVGIDIESSDVAISNSGNIGVSIDVGSSAVIDHSAGIYVSDSNNVTISSSGAIAVSTNLPSANLRALWINNSKVVFKDRFGITFGTRGITRRPIYLTGASTLDLNNANLVVYAGNYIKLYTPYYVIEDNSTLDSVYGEFGGLEERIENPDLYVRWYGEDRGENAAVIFGYKPKKSMEGLAIHGSYTAVRTSMNKVFDFVFWKSILSTRLAKEEREKNRMYASADNVVTDGVYGGIAGPKYRNGFFIVPYFTRITGDDLGYDADVYGVDIGYERYIGSGITVGIFGGYGGGEIDYTETGYQDNDEDQEMYNFGVYSIYNWGNWIGGLLLSYHRIEHDYDGWTGSNLDVREDDEYDSWAFHGRFIGGYKFALNGLELIPIVGISYTSWHTESHTTDADISLWDKHYDDYDEDFVRVLAGLNLNNVWNIGQGTKFMLFGGVRIEQAVDDNEIRVTQSIPGIGAKKSVEEDVSDTSFLGHIGFSVIGERVKVNLVLEGEFNGDYQTYSGYATLGVRF